MTEDLITSNYQYLTWMRDYIDCPADKISDEVLQGFLNEAAPRVAAARALRFYYALEFPLPLVAATWRMRI